MYIGELRMMATATAPTGWLYCDGSAVSRSVYASLFAKIGTVYGAGDGTTTFNIPDFRGRAAVGRGENVTEGFSERVLGETGGEETHVLTEAEMPSHNHAVNASNATGDSVLPENAIPGNTVGLDKEYKVSPFDLPVVMASAMIANKGGSGAHNNMQPFAVVNFIICYAKS